MTDRGQYETVAGADTALSQRIWQVVAAIPAGKVSTYGEVARRAGLPGAARRVGAALRKLPADTGLPWHRVINARGRLSLPADSPAGVTQRRRLVAEGVRFRGNDSISLGDFGWDTQPQTASPPAHAAAAANRR